MNTNESKIMGLSEAVATYVKNGCHLSIGGFTINRNPMAAVYEIIRQKIKGLHVYAHSNGQGVDELVGAALESMAPRNHSQKAQLHHQVASSATLGCRV